MERGWVVKCSQQMHPRRGGQDTCINSIDMYMSHLYLCGVLMHYFQRENELPLVRFIKDSSRNSISSEGWVFMWMGTRYRPAI